MASKNLTPQNVDALVSAGFLRPETAQTLQPNMSVMSEPVQEPVEDVVQPEMPSVFEAPETLKAISTSVSYGKPVQSEEEASLLATQEAQDTSLPMEQRERAINFLYEQKRQADGQKAFQEAGNQMALNRQEARIASMNQKAAELGFPGAPEVVPAATQESEMQRQASDVEDRTNAADEIIKRQQAAQEAQLRAQERAQAIAIQKEEELLKAQTQLEKQVAEKTQADSESFADRLRFALAVGLGSIGSSMTGGENPALLMWKKRQEQIENDKKLKQEEKIAAQKLELEKAQLQLRKLDSQTDNQYKKAQIAKLDAELAQLVQEKNMKLQFSLKGKTSEGIPESMAAMMSQDDRDRMVRLPNGNYALSFNKKQSENLNKYISEIQPAIEGAKRLQNIANDPNFSRLSLQDRAKTAVEIKALVGQLRLPFTGPGQLTEKEYDRLLSTVGDPTSLASLPYLERAKIDTLVNKLVSDLNGQYRASGIDIGTSQSIDDKKIELLIQQNPGVSREKIEAAYKKQKGLK